MNAHNRKPLSNNRIGIFGKGGSGKSTVAVLLTNILARNGYHVLFLDADSTNKGLSKVLGFQHSPKTLLEYFGGMIFSGGIVTCPVDDPTPLEGAEISLQTLPANYYVQKERITLLVAGKISDQGPGAGCDGPIAKIARDLRVTSEDDPLVTIVDFKAGFEDSARGALTGLDWIIVVADPTIAAMELSVDMKDMVKRIHSGELPATMHLESPYLVSMANFQFQRTKIVDVLTVLNKVVGLKMENYMRAYLSKRGIEPVCVLYNHPAVTNSWLSGKPLKVTILDLEVDKIVTALETVVGNSLQMEVAV